MQGMDTKKRLLRWRLPDTAIRGMESHEDGSVTVLAELYRPETGAGDGSINRFEITPEFVKNTFDRWMVDLVDTHDADFDASPIHIAGETEPVEIEKGTLATLANLHTFNGPTGRQIGDLIRRHVANLKAGLRPLINLSIGAHDVEFAAGQGPGLTDPPWQIINGKPDHVMVTRAGYQAQDNAGVRIAGTLQEALEEYAEGLDLSRSSGDQPQDTPTTMEIPKEELDALRAALEAEKLKAKTAEDTSAELQDQLKAAEDSAAELQKDKDATEKATHLDEIKGVYKDLEAEMPDTSDWDLARCRVEYTNALLKFRKEAPRKGGAVPHEEPEDKDKEVKQTAPRSMLDIPVEEPSA